jgi:hypothetical protein
VKMCNRVSTGLALGFFLVAGSLAPAPADDAKSTASALAKERITLIEGAMGLINFQKPTKEGTVEVSLKWARRMVDARRQAGSPKAELVAALVDAIEYAEANVKRADASFEAKASTIVDYLEAKDILLDLKIALAQAQAK